MDFDPFCVFQGSLLVIVIMIDGRLATSRPLGERSEPFLAAKRPTASDEVARGRLVSLEGFSFVFRAKSREWRVLDFNGGMY